MPLLVVSVAVAGVATLITGRAWSLGVCLILLALAVVVMAVGPTGAIALAACCLAAGFLSVPAELQTDPGPDPSSL